MPQLVEPSQKSIHNTWIEIRLDRLIQNLAAVKACQSLKADVLAVVKANAYGHGLAQIARQLAPHVQYLGVSSVAEVLEIKKQGIETPIFLFSRLLSHELPALIQDGVTLSVSSWEEASEISALSRARNKKTKIHIKVDTGMGRLGIPFGQAMASIEKIASLPGIEMEGLYTHFPSAEKEDGFSEKQVRDFVLLLQALEKKEIVFRYRHGANSAACLRVKAPVFNMIRPGLMLYGIYPDPSLISLANVSPVLSLKSRLISVKRFQAGQTIGYGREYIVRQPSSIGLLPIGYSHGYPVRASHKACVLYRGHFRPVAGRISMDYLSVDLGDLSARIGDEVTLIGEEDGREIKAEDVADWAGTIPYEIITGFSANLPRQYLEGKNQN